MNKVVKDNIININDFFLNDPIYEDRLLSVEDVDDMNYTHPNFISMTGMIRPKKQYDMESEHLKAHLEDLKVDFELIARKIMYMETLI